MNRHQVLTGAVNAGENCFSVGGVDGVPFIGYAAGCNIVILTSNFQRVQIIPGVRHENVQVSCLDCSADFGKIAVSYGKKISIFEATPLLKQSTAHRLDYRWVQTATLTADCHTRVLSWNPDGRQLLTGGDCIQMWLLTSKGPLEDEKSNDQTDDEDDPKWECIWKCKTSNPVTFLKFSFDGMLFASAGSIDRLVKIWYENKKVNFVSQNGGNEVSFTFIYIAHPRAITSLSWRKTSKYMPRSSVSNMLVTSCKDNICRLWVQTLLPEDGLINIQQIEALANQAPHMQTQRQRQRIMQRLKHMKSFNQYKKRQATQFIEESRETIPTLPSTYSIHDFHSFGVQGSAVAPGIHFHLAASINAATDIPLVPSISSGGSGESREPSFVLHWLNNKEVVFSEETELLLKQLNEKVTQQEMAATAAANAAHANVGGNESDNDSSDDGTGGGTTGNGTFQAKNRKVNSDAEEFSNGGPDDPKIASSFSLNTTGSADTAANVGGQPGAPLIDALDRKIDSLLSEWQNSPDLLFSIHPVDGSFLVWLVEWLDECSPGSFRQAQVSFCSRIPNAFPLGDAATMAEHLLLYSPRGGIALRAALRDTVAPPLISDFLGNNHSSMAPDESCSMDFPSFDLSPTPVLCMISKHINGSLNLWNLTFGDSSSYTQVLSISHSSRVCGHRFRINDVTCHPVLPLLLTTSHHNAPLVSENKSSPNSQSNLNLDNDVLSHQDELGFCSELILWKVDPVGPLCKSGGVSELARINSPEISAFANIAWIPTLLPSTTLGSISNSPSACFVASDGQHLRIYQAVIDARTILAEVSASARKNRQEDRASSASSSTSSGMGYRQSTSLQESFRIVSLQSTARPGCILELDAISDANHVWQNTQMLHVFQEQLITGRRSDSQNDQSKGPTRLVEPGLQAVVDLRNSVVFEEPFYLVVLEKNNSGHSVLHMWKILLSSHPGQDGEENNDVGCSYVPDSNLVQDSDHSNQSSRSNSPQPERNPLACPLHISTSKVCTQILTISDEVTHAAPAAGHLSSSSIYPACLAPYLLCTACADGAVRFWKCKRESDVHFEWAEWTMMMNSQESYIEVPGQPLYVSCAYSGRVACAYKHGRSYTKMPSASSVNSGEDDSQTNGANRFVNISVAIFECESTGGSEWVLEDTVPLKNVSLPRLPEELMDLDSLYDASERNRKTVDTLMHRLAPRDGAQEHRPSIQKLMSVPSYTTLHTLRHAIVDQGNQSLLTQKSLVQLDWVSTEDGSHVLTVSVGSKVLLLTPVSTDIAQANVQALKSSKSVGRSLLKQASSMAPALLQPEEMRWMCLRTTHLSTQDGLPPLPMQLCWVRDGILVVGMDSEMHIYSQWRPEQTNDEEPEDKSESIRSLTEQEILSRAQDSLQLRLPGVPSGTSIGGLSRNSSSHVISSWTDSKKKKETKDVKINFENLPCLPDFGLFEASRLACPVLPQYHPKQLTELLEFGKITRVKAILCHLVRCLAGMENFKKSYEHFLESADVTEGVEGSGGRTWSRSRALSIAASSPLQPSPNEGQTGGGGGSLTVFPEEIQLDYVEVTSIPPLPLFTLLAVDASPTSSNSIPGAAYQQSTTETKTYDELFETVYNFAEENNDPFSMENSTPPKIEKSNEDFSIANFGPRQVKLLTKLLTHTHLPGLSSLDQMHVLALADTVASCSSSFQNRLSNPQYLSEKLGTGANQLAVSIDSLDDCGLRFLFSLRHHTYLMCCLPLAQRAHLQKKGLTSHSLVWAFHSETQEELLQLVPAIQKANPKWNDLRELGFGWWIRSNALLKQVMEKVAKSAFQAASNPLDAALFYLAMKKKNLVWGLFRSVRDTKMTAFFANNFAEDRWRKAALKNAFALLGKQRFEHAAAFFLLAGALRDAVDVCLHKLEDLQLAMVLVRLNEGELETETPPGLKRLLYEEVLGCDRDGLRVTSSSGGGALSGELHIDPFLRSMALWIIRDYSGALTTLLKTNNANPKFQVDNFKWERENLPANPSVFNFYLYLRTHPLVVRSYSLQYSHKTVKLTKTGKYMKSTILSPGHVDSWLARDDAITPLERRLFFTTAHYHFQAGCPALALEVLSRLPENIIMALDVNETPNLLSPIIIETTNDSAKTFDWSESSITTTDIKIESTNSGGAASFDWSQSTIGGNVSAVESEPIDWSQPSFQTDKLVWDTEDKQESDPSSDEDAGIQIKAHLSEELESAADDSGGGGSGDASFDVMAQQLKFIACLKIMMEELSTLATGFEVDGGKLRYHLYIWLERSVASLCELCNYGKGHGDLNSMGTEEFENDRLGPGGVASGGAPANSNSGGGSGGSLGTEPTRGGFPTLHEILIADTLDFEDKLQRAARRKTWLKANETLLRTLLSYCSLHGAHGGGLAAVRMELMLLLQELQQERSQHQLLSPLPFPTTLPLLAASVASQKTVVTDPIRFLQSLTHDILETVTTLRHPPTVTDGSDYHFSILRDLSTSLSACIYQSLCDSDNFLVKQSGSSAIQQDFISSSVVYQNSHLLAGHNRTHPDGGGGGETTTITSPPNASCTAPNKWPGVQSLRALLARDKDEDSPKLHTLLCEAFVSVYLSQLIHGLGTYDCHILYRLIDRNFSENTWSMLFGGGTKRLLRVSTAVSPAVQGQTQQESNIKEESGESSLFNTLSKQRLKLHMKLLGQLGQGLTPQPTIKEDRPTYREQFVPPEMSMVSCFMAKPILSDENAALDYDSNDSIPSSDDEQFNGDEQDGNDQDDDQDDDDDVLVDDLGIRDAKLGRGGSGSNVFMEQLEPLSFSWAIMRLGVVKLANCYLLTFLNVAGIELQDLPVTSPTIHASLKVLEQWLKHLKFTLDAFGRPPTNFLPNLQLDSSRNASSPADKYKLLIDLNNTPFKSHHPLVMSAKRLWSYMVRQEPVQDIFIRYIFSRKHQHLQNVDDVAEPDSSNCGDPSSVMQPIRIVHKDQDSILSFCISKVNQGALVLSTLKEIQELDISLLLEAAPWLEDEAEYDILNSQKSVDLLPASDYIVVQHPSDKSLSSGFGPTALNSGTGSTFSSPTGPAPPLMGSQTGRASTVMRKHKSDGVRRLRAHPFLPLYLAGGQDGSVKMWEWAHQQPVSVPRPAGTFAKVTRVAFNAQGNKFGVTDGDGYLSLWQLGLTSTSVPPFYSLQCHSKQASDFDFVNSSSLLATAGQSSDGRNVCLWDTLLPQRKAQVAGFPCHENGSSCVVYASRSQLLISAGKKGDICIFDVRQRQLRHVFQAHEHAVKCLTLDPGEEFFVTGSADGDIKVWGLNYHLLLYSFPGEHLRSTLFRNIGMGVSNLHVDRAGRLFSCGADGSLKMRQLPEKDLVVKTIF